MQKLAGFLFVLVVAGCASTTSTTSTSSNTGKYSEDLSIWRPKDSMPPDTLKNRANQPQTDVKKSTTNVEAKFAVNQQLDNVLDSIARINKSIGLIDGFTIQVYSGIKREDALNAKKELSVSLPDLDSEVQYVQPNFRVRVGKYYDRLQAQKDFLSIKRYFPSAIVIPERIPVQ